MLRQLHGPKGLLNKFTKISTEHIIAIRDYCKGMFIKFSRTEKMRKLFTRIGVSICNSTPHSVQTFSLSNFCKKKQITTS